MGEVEVRKNMSRELDPMALQKKKKDDDKVPERGTGRRTGTAKKPTGPKDRLTKEQRRKRHKKKTGE